MTVVQLQKYSLRYFPSCDILAALKALRAAVAKSKILQPGANFSIFPHLGLVLVRINCVLLIRPKILRCSSREIHSRRPPHLSLGETAHAEKATRVVGGVCTYKYRPAAGTRAKNSIFRQSRNILDLCLAECEKTTAHVK